MTIQSLYRRKEKQGNGNFICRFGCFRALAISTPLYLQGGQQPSISVTKEHPMCACYCVCFVLVQQVGTIPGG